MKTTDLDIAALPDRARTLAARLDAEAPADARRSQELAAILLSLQVDEDLLLAGLVLPPLESGAWTLETVSEACGAEAARLAAELRRIAEVPGARDWMGGAIDPAQAENLRKLLIALASDLRLVLLRLALQLARLRAAKTDPEPERRALAAETREIYAPLANRLGIWQLKWELEDLAFRYLEPEEYKRIAGWLRARREERERYIEDVKQSLARELEQAGIQGQISGRPKHIYSIWRKMQRKGLAFEQVMDVLAVRVIVASVADCYAALGIVHGLWPYVPGEFDDYIATPKDNDYRSLHTAVVGPGTLPLEVQIRTEEMHRHAELGVAAHWQYKEGRKASGADQQKVQWLRQLIDPSARGPGEQDLLDQLRAEVFEDRVYALSPRGEVVDLPRDATPLDFAYHVHTELGHRCRGARVNGRIVPLDHHLANGDTVEIIAGKTASPSRDWLVPQLGFLASQRNRGKVRAWFRKQGEAQNREQGRQMLEHELERLNVRSLPLPELLGELSLPDADTLHRLLGEGELTLAQVAGAVHRRLQAREPVLKPPPATRPEGARSARGLVVEGVGDLLSSFARCCRPVPPEAIAGYLTLGRGVSVHRADCASFLHLRDAHPERVLAVDWGQPGNERRFPVRIEIEAFDRRGLVRDVSAVLADQKISIEAMNTVTNPRDNTAAIGLTVSVHGLDELSRLLTRLGGLPNVIRAQRGR